VQYKEGLSKNQTCMQLISGVIYLNIIAVNLSLKPFNLIMLPALGTLSLRLSRVKTVTK